MNILLATSYSQDFFNVSPPVGLYRLAHAVEREGHSCRVADLNFDTLETIEQEAASGRYDIIGMSVSHSHMSADADVIARLRAACKGQDVLFIAGGQEATYNYKQWLALGLDVVFLGYAERALAQVASQWEKGGGLSALARIPGIAFVHNGAVIFNPYPYPDQEEFEFLTHRQVLALDLPYAQYWERARRTSTGLSFQKSVFVPETVRLYTSSHCPNHCSYCSSHGFLRFASQHAGGKILALSAEQVFDLAVDAARRYGAKGILFCDDEFLAPKGRIETFCRLVEAAQAAGDFPKDFQFNCQARVVDFLRNKNGLPSPDIERIRTLRGIGFHSIGLGVESFSRRLLGSPSMNKHGYGGDEAVAVIDAMLETGLTPQVNVILFVLETTREEIFHSMECAMACVRKGCTIAVTPKLLAIPGAPLYEAPGTIHEEEERTVAENGTRLLFKTTFIPFDPEVGEAAKRIEQAVSVELQAFKDTGAVGDRKVNKTFMGVLTMVATARLLNRQALADSWFEELVGIARNSFARP